MQRASLPLLAVALGAAIAHAHAGRGPLSTATLQKKLDTFVAISSDHGYVSEGLWTALGLKRGRILVPSLNNLPYRYVLSALEGKRLNIRGGETGTVVSPSIYDGVPTVTLATPGGKKKTVPLAHTEPPEEPLGEDVHFSHDQVLNPLVVSNVLLAGLEGPRIFFVPSAELRSTIAETIAVRLGQGHPTRLRSLSLAYRATERGKGDRLVLPEAAMKMGNTGGDGVWFTGVIENTPFVRHPLFIYAGYDREVLEQGRRAITKFESFVGPASTPSDIDLSGFDLWDDH